MPYEPKFGDPATMVSGKYIGQTGTFACWPDKGRKSVYITLTGEKVPKCLRIPSVAFDNDDNEPPVSNKRRKRDEINTESEMELILKAMSTIAVTVSKLNNNFTELKGRLEKLEEQQQEYGDY